MDAAQFDGYLAAMLPSYAAQNVKSGRWTEEESVAEARKQLDGLLPAGLATPNNHLLAIVTGSPQEKVGVVWLAIEPRGGFIYDLEVFEPFRRRGYGEAAMRELEGFARARGARKLLLHVFGDNDRARKLYLKLGYVETNVLMAKPLGP